LLPPQTGRGTIVPSAAIVANLSPLLEVALRIAEGMT
jgi:hypothetical protein